MKIRVISEFYDKYHTSTLFKVGTVLDFDDERANDIISKKLAEPFVEPKKPGRPPKQEEAKVEDAKPADVKPAPEQNPAEQPAEPKKEEAKPAEQVEEHKADNKEKAE